MDELSEDDSLTVYRARKIQRFLSQPFHVAEIFTGTKGQFVPLIETIKGFRDIVSGKYDHLPEQAFYMVGNIETVIAKAETIAAEVAQNKARQGGAATTTKTDAKGATTTTATKVDKRSPEYLIRPPRPTESNELIMNKLKDIAIKTRDAQLAQSEKYAAIKADHIAPGWNYPKKEQILEEFAHFEKLHREQPDIIAAIGAHFAASTAELEIEREQLKAELAK